MLTSVRHVDTRDATVLAALERACLGPDAWSELMLREEIGHPDRVMLVAELDDVVVGYVDVGVVAEVADLHRVVVDASARRRGLATSLLDQGLRLAAEQGATRVLLEVAADNEAALGLYDGHGFTEIARRRGYYARGRDAVVMQADLPDRGRAGCEACR